MILDYSAIGDLQERIAFAQLTIHLGGYAEAFEIKNFGHRLWQIDVVKQWDYVGELVEATVR